MSSRVVRIGATIALAALLTLALLAVSGGPSRSETVTAAPIYRGAPQSLHLPDSVSAYTGFLPISMRHHCVPYTPTSPFALQIAALHEIDSTSLLAERSRPLTQDETLALYRETYGDLLDALRDSGAAWSRVRVAWWQIQQSEPPAPYSWGWYDTKLQLVAATGVDLIVTVAGPPDWAGIDSCPPITPDRLDDFGQFLTDLVLRYSEPPYDVKIWEMSNEPDGVLPSYISGLDCWGDHGEAFAQMLARAYSAITDADPEAIVLMGGIAYDGFTEYEGIFNRYFVDDVMSAGGGAAVDAVTFHYFDDYFQEWERWDPSSEDRQRGWLPAPTCGIVDDGIGASYYAGGIDVIAKTNHLRNRLGTCFGVQRPIWITELASHGYPGDVDSLTNQARYVIQGHVRALAAGVDNITWFALVSPPYDPHEQGLLYQDTREPKPAYYAYQTLTRELAAYSYHHTIGGVAGEAYVFRNVCLPDKTVAWGTGTLSFSAASTVSVTNRNGESSYIFDGQSGDLDGIHDGAIVVQLTTEPRFFVAHAE
ncbi:MAG: cellulase family glycosylhydrolase [Chloroflexi bacterium]|nr:cellulase family glycosylhydrolase [Chloroflexota bacterium]